jgi:hypothetical protein
MKIKDFYISEELNALTVQDIHTLQSLCDYEIENFLFLGVPKYLSGTAMHSKYINDIAYNKLCKIILSIVQEHYSAKFFIHKSWFNICKKDSIEWNWHSHPDCDIVVNYFLKNKDDNCGTLFQSDNNVIQKGGKENTFICFPPDIIHKTPCWPGYDRYTITYQLNFE